MALWQKKAWVILGTFVFTIAAVFYALRAAPVFRAEATVQIRQQSPGGGLGALTANLGGLASLVGISAGGAGSARTIALATLRSRSLLEAFIKEHDLLPILFPDQWSSEQRQWKSTDSAQRPTLWAGVQALNNGILQIKDDPQGGLLQVAVEWTDPKQAADWANAIIKKTNDVLRERALADGQATLAYLQEEVKKTPTVEIQTVAYGLMEGEMQKLMMARGVKDYALEVIDPAVAPEMRIRPKRTAIVITGAAVGFIIGCLGALIAFSLGRPQSRAA